MAFKRCKSPFAFTDGGMTRVVASGAIVSTDDAAYNDDTAELFEDIEGFVGEQTAGRNKAAGKPVVEDATAEPGELRRGPGRPPKQRP